MDAYIKGSLVISASLTRARAQLNRNWDVSQSKGSILALKFNQIEAGQCNIGNYYLWLFVFHEYP